MKISARNKLKSTIVEIKEGEIMAEVILDVGGQRLIAVITKDAVQELNLKKGDSTLAMIKSTEVMLIVE